ncbi:hypothetical protein GCM10007049_01110 [Echinicola pacifica]|uniref:Spheroidene monooxygenase n=2 Tax=Echinicola pacifica TaxID=346377 RepID=A0A918PJG1_9BACT|nr:hypothetical protein GCM10007049_01110 [Echinicola pacifica]
MTLGAPIFSPSRVLFRQIAIFAQWENEAAINDFLSNDKLGRKIATGWHIRMTFLRQWGKISGLKLPENINSEELSSTPVVAVTIAKMKIPAIPRFIYWGRPVEKLVRDHPAALLANASIKLPNTVSTFSIWKSSSEMINMVQGHSVIPMPKRHVNAMSERERKDFHFEFTTLRFSPISEYGSWKGQKNIIPNLPNPS